MRKLFVLFVLLLGVCSLYAARAGAVNFSLVNTQEKIELDLDFRYYDEYIYDVPMMLGVTMDYDSTQPIDYFNYADLYITCADSIFFPFDIVSGVGYGSDWNSAYSSDYYLCRYSGECMLARIISRSDRRSVLQLRIFFRCHDNDSAGFKEELSLQDKKQLFFEGDLRRFIDWRLGAASHKSNITLDSFSLGIDTTGWVYYDNSDNHGGKGYMYPDSIRGSADPARMTYATSSIQFGCRLLSEWWDSTLQRSDGPALPISFSAEHLDSTGSYTKTIYGDVGSNYYPEVVFDINRYHVESFTPVTYIDLWLTVNNPQGLRYYTDTTTYGYDDTGWFAYNNEKRIYRCVPKVNDYELSLLEARVNSNNTQEAVHIRFFSYVAKLYECAIFGSQEFDCHEWEANDNRFWAFAIAIGSLAPSDHQNCWVTLDSVRLWGEVQNTASYWKDSVNHLPVLVHDIGFSKPNEVLKVRYEAASAVPDDRPVGLVTADCYGLQLTGASGEASLQVTDILGRGVAINPPCCSSDAVRWNFGNGLASGVYCYVIQEASKAWRGKFIVH